MNNGLVQWSPGVTLEHVEMQVILYAFEFYKRNKTATANALGISIRTLDDRLEKYGEQQQRQKQAADAQRNYERRQLDAARGKDANGNDLQRRIVTETHEETTKRFLGPNARLRVESPTEATTKQAVPVSQPQKVQEVLPSSTSAGGSRSRR